MQISCRNTSSLLQAVRDQKIRPAWQGPSGCVPAVQLEAQHAATKALAEQAARMSAKRAEEANKGGKGNSEG